MRSGPDNFLTLYKYRSLAEPHGRSGAEDIILHNRLFWQSPITFNDPFDCSPFLFFGNNTHERNDFARRAASSQPGLSRTQRRMKLKEIASMQTDEHEATFRTKWKTWMGETAVSCFSEKNDHPLMWSHYANSHRGICFIFQ